jgi:beta-lactamase regulating signal transducer with metallopeptidase domain
VDALSQLAATFILNALWQVALMAGLALGADRFLRRAPAQFRHTLWMIALAGAVALPVSTLRPSLARRGSVTYSIGAAMSLAEAPSGQFPAGFWQIVKSWLNQAAHNGIPLPRPWARGLIVLYAAFLGIKLLRLARAWRRARQIARLASSSGIPAHITVLAEQYRRALAAPSRLPENLIRVMISAEISGPVTVGARRAAIVLPEKLLEGNCDAELRAALGHELAHVRRRDCLRNLIYELILLPISFHPLAQLIRQRLACTRELACDEMAAALLGRRQYAGSLVRMAHDISRCSTAPKAGTHHGRLRHRHFGGTCHETSRP